MLLLPRGRLPLNIFEPRYLAMTRDALAHGGMIGMIQPQEGAGRWPAIRARLPHRLRRAASSTSRETDDGRYLITLKGVRPLRHRDRAAARQALFRIVVPDWSRYARRSRRGDRDASTASA